VNAYDALIELVRIAAYGGIGWFAGYLAGVTVNDRHRLTVTILDEAERDDMSSSTNLSRRILRADLLQTITVVVVMVAMLLTGLAWMRTGQDVHRQQEENCAALANVSTVLRNRTNVYLEQATANRRAWGELLDNLVQRGLPDNDPLVASIRSYLEAQSKYLRDLANNPYSKPPEDCAS